MRDLGQIGFFPVPKLRRPGYHSSFPRGDSAGSWDKSTRTTCSSFSEDGLKQMTKPIGKYANAEDRWAGLGPYYAMFPAAKSSPATPTSAIPYWIRLPDVAPPYSVQSALVGKRLGLRLIRLAGSTQRQSSTQHQEKKCWLESSMLNRTPLPIADVPRRSRSSFIDAFQLR